jgi:hypothetical protein
MYQWIVVAGDEGLGYSDGDTYTAPEIHGDVSMDRTRDSDTAKEIHSHYTAPKMHRDV